MGSTPVMSIDEWLCAVQKKLKTTDCQILNVTADRLEDVGGFVGDHMHVKVSVLLHLSSSPEKQELAFFVKRIATTNATQMDLAESTQSFPKESGVLSRLFPMFPGHSPPWAPLCYYVRPDAIILDDLTHEGFRLAGRTKYLDFIHCAILLKTLAVFHAGSIILEENEAKRLNKPCRLNELYPDLLFENFFVNNDTFKTNLWFHSAVESVVSSVKFLTKYKSNVDISNVTLEKVKEFLFQLYDIVKPSAKYRNVLSHGDIWTNNILFKYDGDIPVEVRMVDFALVRYAPPALEVLIFLQINTSQKMREAHREELLSLYYCSLAEELRRHGLKSEDHLPRSEFEETCRVYNVGGIIAAPLLHSLSIFEESILKDSMVPEKFEEFFYGNRCDLMELSCEKDMGYRERYLSELEDLVEYIQKGESSKFRTI